MKYNKESTLAQLKEIEDNLRRIRTLVECDVIGMVPGIGVELYCLKKIELQSVQLSSELIQAFGLPEADVTKERGMTIHWPKKLPDDAQG